MVQQAVPNFEIITNICYEFIFASSKPVFAKEQCVSEGGRKDGVAVISLDGRSPLYVSQGVANGVGMGPDSIEICRCLPSV